VAETPEGPTVTRSSRRLAAVLGLAALLVACGSEGELAVEDARSRMSPMFVGVGAVYLDIVNDTDADDRLVGASVEASIADRVEIHETFDAEQDMADGAMDDDAMDEDAMDEDAMGDGDDDAMGDGGMDDDAMDGDGVEATAEGFAMMGMREIAALDIPAGTTIALVPGGYHLMLLELATDLQPGDEFELTLEFESAGERTVTVTVSDDV
jgi:copper(I)-binding protein